MYTRAGAQAGHVPGTATSCAPMDQAAKVRQAMLDGRGHGSLPALLLARERHHLHAHDKDLPTSSHCIAAKHKITVCLASVYEACMEYYHCLILAQ